eukprot:scaffold192_cov320-Ochromonas_danica.AAC.12
MMNGRLHLSTSLSLTSPHLTSPALTLTSAGPPPSAASHKPSSVKIIKAIINNAIQKGILDQEKGERIKECWLLVEQSFPDGTDAQSREEHFKRRLGVLFGPAKMKEYYELIVAGRHALAETLRKKKEEQIQLHQQMQQQQQQQLLSQQQQQQQALFPQQQVQQVQSTQGMQQHVPRPQQAMAANYSMQMSGGIVPQQYNNNTVPPQPTQQMMMSQYSNAAPFGSAPSSSLMMSAGVQQGQGASSGMMSSAVVQQSSQLPGNMMSVAGPYTPAQSTYQPLPVNKPMQPPPHQPVFPTSAPLPSAPAGMMQPQQQQQQSVMKQSTPSSSLAPNPMQLSQAMNKSSTSTSSQPVFPTTATNNNATPHTTSCITLPPIEDDGTEKPNLEQEGIELSGKEATGRLLSAALVSEEEDKARPERTNLSQVLYLDEHREEDRPRVVDAQMVENVFLSLKGTGRPRVVKGLSSSARRLLSDYMQLHLREVVESAIIGCERRRKQEVQAGCIGRACLDASRLLISPALCFGPAVEDALMNDEEQARRLYASAIAKEEKELTSQMQDFERARESVNTSEAVLPHWRQQDVSQPTTWPEVFVGKNLLSWEQLSDVTMKANLHFSMKHVDSSASTSKMEVEEDSVTGKNNKRPRRTNVIGFGDIDAVIQSYPDELPSSRDCGVSNATERWRLAFRSPC